MCYDGEMTWIWWIWLIVGYLCGSVPFSWLIGKIQGVDIRRLGSGNVGATNVGRILGRKFGVICLLLDVAKGSIPVLCCGWMLGYLGKLDLEPGDSWRWLAVAVMAVLGHVFPVWLKFKGGKGVATGLGVLWGCWPWLALPAVGAVIVWLIVVVLSRYMGLASVFAAGVLPIFLAVIFCVKGIALTTQGPYITVTTSLAILVILRHRGNLVRIWAGTEPKIDMLGK